MRHVIIGSGAAGIAAARTIRSKKEDDEILMVSSDEQIYSRCMLHYYLYGKRSKKELRFVSDDFFEKMRIDYMPSTTAFGVCPEKHTISTNRGDCVYDRLLIASGSKTVIPEGHFTSAANVFGFRNINDIEDIKDYIDMVDRVVIVGAGLMGLDAAYAFLKLGKKVIVIEIRERIMPMQMEPVASANYQQLFEDHGCEFELNQHVVETVTDKAGNIVTVILNSGKQIACDIIVLTAGVSAASDFLEDTGITTKGAVRVNSQMRTKYEDIYAAGNVTMLSGIWSNAVQQGNVAGNNMCGEKAFYTDRFPFKNTANFYGLQTLSLGEVEILDSDEVLIREDQRSYNKLIIREGFLIGAVFQGDISYCGFWQFLVKSRAKVGRADKSLWNLNYADFFRLDEKGEFMFHWKSDFYSKRR